MSMENRTVSADEADIRLDRWFRRHFPTLKQGAIEKLCRTGQVRVDGRRSEASARLVPGQLVRIPPLPVSAPAEAPAAGRLPALDPATQQALEGMILYRDAQLIVLGKPVGLPVQGGPGIVRHLDAWLDGLRFGSEHRPRLVHRLDRDTTGVLVIARTPGVAAKLAAAFRGRMVRKTYWAVVSGRPLPEAGRIDQPLVRRKGEGRGHGARTALAEPDDTEAARAITDYRTLDHAARKLAWLELTPLTGRTHQLRVHCAAIGAPILGDAAYGEQRNTDARGWRNTALVAGLSEMLHLHARRLVLPHPEGGMLEVEADLPPHMAETFATLGFAAPPAAGPRRAARG